MEYLAVFSITALMIIPMLLIFTSQSNNMKLEIINSQIDKIGSEITDAAEEVYYMGYPSKKTIRTNFPEGLTQIEFSGNTLIFYLETPSLTSETIKVARSNITGNLKPYQGLHIISIEATETGSVNITEE
ncbi:hypothetical protein K9L67_02670 [Candidatus Woesearchaeota archaeon]|nr:hypothetical protein [Candidatus Woesearchaeota archaeon]MCF7901107.1 hypothetical protein [Candidatus Woesearchaeota archaeon]MCF8013440.1 hypothetical protein [Candidatus Woesearchaeota archaeon]